MLEKQKGKFPVALVNFFKKSLTSERKEKQPKSQLQILTKKLHIT